MPVGQKGLGEKADGGCTHDRDPVTCLCFYSLAIALLSVATVHTIWLAYAALFLNHAAGRLNGHQRGYAVANADRHGAFPLRTEMVVPSPIKPSTLAFPFSPQLFVSSRAAGVGYEASVALLQTASNILADSRLNLFKLRQCLVVHSLLCFSTFRCEHP